MIVIKWTHVSIFQSFFEGHRLRSMRVRPSTRRRGNRFFEGTHFGQRFRMYAFRVNWNTFYVWMQGVKAQESVVSFYRHKRLRVDTRRKRSRKCAFADVNVYVWTWPNFLTCSDCNGIMWALAKFLIPPHYLLCSNCTYILRTGNLDVNSASVIIVNSSNQAVRWLVDQTIPFVVVTVDTSTAYSS